ncbi:hypothetical protein [Paenibacillus qinlingensis]|uniref:Uncharacterized protein n=1 Tax=Paenibacillus qinlingensis TaxID=1837343 RepID=A0ABU1NWU2_9BACL|nr:hypothetical protein [Paenibacillus qinlingensis]MDR6551317.1 hypothetical protein [Paenibacillus qinlingensis]
MEALIVFLFKNWYLVIIALTFYYQIQSRRKRAAGGETRTRTGMPTFGNGPGDAGRPVEAKTVQAGHIAQRSRPERTRDEFSQSGLGKSVVAPKLKTSPFTPQVTNSSAAVSSPIYSDEISSSRIFPDQPNREQVLQGVVWAEILGPPRAKKPYRR